MKDRGFRTLAIIALLIAVAGISVAFAALAQNLDISATGKVKGAEWNVYWSQAAGALASGVTCPDCSVGTLTTPAGAGVTNLTITGIVLEKPGDKVEWTFTAHNEGTLDAKLGTFTDLFTKTITIDPADVTEGWTADDVIVTLTKADGTAVQVANELLKKDSAPSNEQQYKLTVEFRGTATDVPSKDIEISITAQFPWVQK